jgi:outer membrane protein insertion porin family
MTKGMRLRNLGALSLLGCWLVLMAPTSAHPEPLIVAVVRIEGNERVEKDAILFHVTQEPDEPFDQDAVNEDVHSIYKMGFFLSVSTKIVYDNGQAVLVYTVKERPQVIRVRIEGMEALSRTDPRVVQAIKVHDGYILDPTAVRETIENLKSVYKDEGYIDAQVTFVAVPRSNNTMISTFKVTETPEQ